MNDGDDRMYCDPGATSDAFDYSARTAGVTVVVGGSDNGETGTEHDLVACDLPAGTSGVTIIGGAGNDVLVGSTSLANWIDAGNGNDEVYGGDYPDTLLGRGGDDLLVGGGGNDHLRGSSGNDVLEGGPGNAVQPSNDTLYDCELFQ